MKDKFKLLKDKIHSLLKQHNAKDDKRFSVILISLVCFLVFLFIFVQIKAKSIQAENLRNIQKEAPPLNVITMPIKAKTLYDKINLVAITKAWASLNLQSQVAGEIIQKEIQEGDFVEAGKDLIIIDKEKYQNGFNAMDSYYESALERFQRVEKLYQKQISSKADFDTARAAKDQAKAQRDNAKLDLEKCVVKAPISGFINQIFIEKGQVVGIGTPLLEIIDTSKIKVKVGIPESDVAEVQQIEDFVVTIDALKGKEFNAKKHFLSKSTGEAVRVYSLDLKLDNEKGEILSDMFARVDVVKSKVENSVSVPIFAVLNLGERKVLFVEKDGEAEERTVELGIQDGLFVQIKDGLKLNENLVVVGQNNLTNNQKVKVVKTVKNIEELNQ